MCVSNLPGRKMAGSTRSGREVAMEKNKLNESKQITIELMYKK